MIQYAFMIIKSRDYDMGLFLGFFFKKDKQVLGSIFSRLCFVACLKDHMTRFKGTVSDMKNLQITLDLKKNTF